MTARPGHMPTGIAPDGRKSDQQQTPSSDTARLPHRWKIWLMTTLGIYPVITALTIATQPLLHRFPLPVRLAILIPTSVAIMQWLLLPFLHRTLKSWLLRWPHAFARPVRPVRAQAEGVDVRYPVHELRVPPPDGGGTHLVEKPLPTKPTATRSVIPSTSATW
jgi:hypothetical protein